MTQREQSRRARERALEVVSLRRQGFTWREIGERLGGVTRVRAYQIGKRGRELSEARAAKGIL